MKGICPILLLLTLAVVSPYQLLGQGKFSFEFLPGGAVSLPSKLTIHQEGYPDITLAAKYRHDNLILPFYYSYRASWSINNSWGVEIEMNHLKIILENRPAEIAEFSVTHGYNQVWINIARIFKGFTFRAGIGGVVAHPENTIRGKKYDQDFGLFKEGYHLCGTTTQLAVQKKYYIGHHFYFSGEIKFNGAYARIPIVDGFAKTPVFALHGLVGAGIHF